MCRERLPVCRDSLAAGELIGRVKGEGYLSKKKNKEERKEEMERDR